MRCIKREDTASGYHAVMVEPLAQLVLFNTGTRPEHRLAAPPRVQRSSLFAVTADVPCPEVLPDGGGGQDYLK